MHHLTSFEAFSSHSLSPPYSPFPLLILSFMRTWRATYISPHGVETNFAFVSDTEAVRVEDVLQQAIQSLNSL